MKNLEEAGKSNMIYSLIRCLSLPDSAGHPTRLHLERMPTGYIEHQLNFFNASHYFSVRSISHVIVNLTINLIIVLNVHGLMFQVPTCPRDYSEWLVTMYAEFEKKWHCLHNDPAWHHSGLRTNMVPGAVSVVTDHVLSNTCNPLTS